MRPLSERLPKDYSVNLANCTSDERQAVQEDLKRWNHAHKMIREMSVPVIRHWLETHSNHEYRDDMRRRLNYFRGIKKPVKGDH